MKKSIFILILILNFGCSESEFAPNFCTEKIRVDLEPCPWNEESLSQIIPYQMEKKIMYFGWIKTRLAYENGEPIFVFSSDNAKIVTPTERVFQDLSFEISWMENDFLYVKVDADELDSYLTAQLDILAEFEIICREAD